MRKMFLLASTLVAISLIRLYGSPWTEWVDGYAGWLKANPPPQGLTPIPSPSPTPTPRPSPTPTGKFKVGDHVMPTTTVNVRETPGGALVGTQGPGIQGTVSDGPMDAILNGTNIVWWKVQFADPPSGWTGEDNLVPYVAPAPTPTPAPASHFVKPDGSDSNDGTSADKAWKTIGKAIQSAPLGATVSIAAGTYSESPNFNRTASASQPLTFRGAPSNASIISGPVNVSGQHITVDGFKTGVTYLQSSGGNPPAFLLSGSSDTVANCLATGLTGVVGGDEGVCFVVNGDHNIARTCTVSNTDNVDAFRIFGDSNVIDGCIGFNHRNTQYSAGPHADLLQTWGSCKNALIQNCIFWDAPHQFGTLATNPGGSGSSCFNCTFRNNVIIDSEQFFMMIKGFNIYNNLWYQSAKSIGDLLFFDQGQFQPYVLKNNAYVSCGTSAGNGFIQGGIQGGTAVDHNFFNWNNGQVSHGIGSNAVNGGDPQFVDPDNRDFHTKPGSPLRGAGVAISPSFPDRDGKPRPTSGAWDIGPYQSQ